MKKKYGFIFLGFGFILFVLFGLYNYTNLFNQLDKTNDRKIPENNENNENIVNNTINYDYIKSYDINKKAKVTFPIYNNLTVDYNNRTDFYKSYYNDDGFSIYATIYDNNFVNTHENSSYNVFKSTYENDGYKVSRSEIKCQYMCVRYQVYNQDNSIFADKLKVFLASSSNEVAEISYSYYGKSLSDEMINTIINNIKVSNDATYTIGNIINGKLSINLQVNEKKYVNVLLDNNLYEEIIDENNSTNATTIKNKNNNLVSSLIVKHKRSDISLKEDIKEFYQFNKSNIDIKELVINGKTFYEFVLDDKIIYALQIDDTSELIIRSNDKQINIDDFKNIKIYES